MAQQPRQTRHLKIVFGMFIGTFTGISLMMGVLPFVFSTLLELAPFAVVEACTRPHVMVVVLFWGACGGLVAWRGGTKVAAGVFGLAGLLSGLGLGTAIHAGMMALRLAGPEIETQILMAAAIAGLLYGGLGGVILGAVFPTGSERAVS